MRKSVITAAIGLHLIVTISILLIGSSGMFAHFINGEGLIVGDSQTYQSQLKLAANVIGGSGIIAWFLALLPFHVKLYSISFLITGWLFGSSILALEPLNAALYLAVLYLVLKLSEEIFENGAGLQAAAIIGLWPSFLLYTTQPLRDALFIAITLCFILINVRWLTRTYSLPAALAALSAGAVVECLLWLSRSDMWELMMAFNLISFALLCVRAVRGRTFLRWNMTGAFLMLILSLLIPRVAVQFYRPAYELAKSHHVAFTNYDEALSNNQQAQTASQSSASQQVEATYLPARISSLRERFVTLYAGAASNIDSEVRFNSMSDIILYVPRAMMIGLFAPFPTMWFAEGAQTGRAGRLIAGIETLALYFIELMALVGLYHRRRQLSAWLLFGISITGLTALALVVTNIGALYRMRFVFVILLVILSSEGFRQTFKGAFLQQARAGGK